MADSVRKHQKKLTQENLTQSQNPTTSNASIVQPGDTDVLLSLFQCCICDDHATEKIYQCALGRHYVCSNCRPRITSCPQCRTSMSLGESRNFLGEQVAKLLIFPCKFQSNGCKVSCKSKKKIEHEIDCEYRDNIYCPSPVVDCKWQGSHKSIVPHFKLFHKDIMNSEGEDIIFLAINVVNNESNNWIMFQSCHDEFFLLSLIKAVGDDAVSTQFFGIVQLIGPRKEAKKFLYRMELNAKGQQASWKSLTRSIYDDTASLIKNNNCFAFNGKTAKIFTVNENLELYVSIVKV